MTVSTLGNILLSLIATEGGDTGLSGYALAILLRKPAAQFWHATHTQIYADLERLHMAGLLSYVTESQDGKPDKKLYRLTESGQVQLQSWLAAPTEAHGQRDELMIKSLSLWLAEPQVSATHLREQARIHQENLERYQAFMRETEVQWNTLGQPRDQPEFGRYIVLKRLISLEQEALDWCLWVIHLLTASDAP